MGVVYEAVDERIGRRVAVKVMSPKRAADEAAFIFLAGSCPW